MQNRYHFFFMLFLSYMLVLVFLLFSNDLTLNYSRFPLQDKMIHFGAFFLGQLLIMLTGKMTGIFKWSLYILFLSLPAVSEIVQETLPRRVSDIWDMLAGYLGILSCLAIWYLFKIIHKHYFLKER